MCFFQLLIPGLTFVSLLESESGFGIVTQHADNRKRPSSHLLSMVKKSARLRASHSMRIILYFALGHVPLVWAPTMPSVDAETEDAFLRGKLYPGPEEVDSGRDKESDFDAELPGRWKPLPTPESSDVPATLVKSECNCKRKSKQ
jgi:hypothetical protein